MCHGRTGESNYGVGWEGWLRSTRRGGERCGDERYIILSSYVYLYSYPFITPPVLSVQQYARQETMVEALPFSHPLR